MRANSKNRGGALENRGKGLCRGIGTKDTGSKTISVGTLNIVDRKGNGLELACNQLSGCNMDICILTETKLNDKHTTKSSGYNIISAKSKNIHQGGISIVNKTDNNNNWHLEGTKVFGQNVTKSTLVHNDQRTTIIGAYLPPSKISKLLWTT